MQNFSMRKIHPKRETTFWRKNRQLDHVQNSGMFCSKFIIIILFIPSFFFLKKYYLSFNIDFDINTALNTREENIWKMLKKKRRKMQTRENLWGEIIFLKKEGKKTEFLFSKFSIQCQPFSPIWLCPFCPPNEFIEPWVLYFVSLSVIEIWNVIVSVSSSFKKNHLVFQRKKRKKPVKKLTINRKKNQVKKNHGSKYAIFFVCYFLEYCAKTVAKIVENKMAVFLWRKKTVKKKKWRKIPQQKMVARFYFLTEHRQKKMIIVRF